MCPVTVLFYRMTATCWTRCCLDKKDTLVKIRRKTQMNDLNRFLKAQKDDYDIALAKIRSGHKRSHWICFLRDISAVAFIRNV